MNWLHSLDVAGFRLVNQSLANPVLDAVMPWLSANRLFAPALLAALAWLAWRGGARGRVCVVMLVLGLLAGNLIVFEGLKELFARPRPFVDLPDVRLLVGRGSSFSLPSSHAGNWFLACGIMAVYYRRSLWALAPLACAVSLSRVYNGVHYPSDILAGAVVGASLGAGGVWLLDAAWRRLGRAWFPLWWRQLPSWRRPVFHPDPLAWQPAAPAVRDPAAAAEHQWLRLGHLLLATLLAFRLAYIASDTILLSEDEAYQWLWSKHLALSYYSKPPLIAYIQWAGTHLWGDTELGVRFFSPVFGALTGWLMLRFFAAHFSARAGFWLLVMFTTAPLLAVGSILMTIDPPLVLCWTAAMVSGWRALQPGGATRQWAWTGLWLGLGFLSKYIALAQWASFALVFALWPAARRHLRRPGPYLALALTLLCTTPVLVWNAQHDWITVTHVGENAQLGRVWKPTLRYVFDFTGAMLGLLNPVYLAAIVWAGWQVWRLRAAHPVRLYLLLMGAPLFLGMAAFTLYGRVLPNWVAASVVPLFAMLAAHADARWRAGGCRWCKPALVTGLILGGLVVTLLHETNWAAKILGRPLPARQDPLRRVRYSDQVARVVDEERQRLAAEGQPVFIIGGHYGITGLISFYLPEAMAAVQAGRTFVYAESSDRPQNQFFFWPGYADRKGQNAIYADETSGPIPAPARLLAELESVTDLGVREIVDRGRVMKRIQLFACRGLR